MSSRRQMLEFLSLRRLPIAFQEVEYIESSGTQYIDSGVNTSATTEIEFDFFPLILNDTQRYFGSLISSGSGRGFGFGLRNDGQLMFATNNTWNYNIGSISSIRYKVEYKNDGKLYINNSLISTYSVVNADSQSIILFAINYNNSIYTLATMKLYSCKIYNNGTLVRNFVPCYRKADNVAGLYDLVNGVFYTNAGTGTFTKGPNV